MSELQLISNRIDGATVESRQRSGREWLVAPVVMLCEGVLNGELVPAAEFGKHAASWNGRPVMLGHPMQDGQAVSANDPDTLDRLSVGRVFETTTVEGKLKAQMWIDVDRASRSEDGREVVRRLRAGQPVEVSTAYWRDLEGEPGELNGAAYAGIARNLKPDHLAMLIHDVGACSVADGCGAPRVNTEAQMGEDVTIGTTDSGCGDREVADDGHESGLIQALKQMTSAVLGFFQEAKMSETEKLLEESGAPFDVGSLSEEQVEWLVGRLEPLVVTPAPEPAANEGEQKDEEPVLLALDVGAQLDALLTDVGGLAGLKAKLAQIRDSGLLAQTKIVARLAANQRCVLSQAQLEKLDAETLEGIEQSLRPADYRGQGGGPQSNAGGKVEELKKPVLFMKEA